jgi:hypothetical protein
MNIGIEKLIAMYIIACGDWNGVQWELFPKLPTCFTDNLDFQSSYGCNADFLRLTVNDIFGVEVWFVDENGCAFYYGLNEIKKSHPYLFVTIVTHIFDMIENLDIDV